MACCQSVHIQLCGGLLIHSIGIILALWRLIISSERNTSSVTLLCSLILSSSEWYKFGLDLFVFRCSFHPSESWDKICSAVLVQGSSQSELRIYRNMNWNFAVLQIGVYSCSRHFLSHLLKFECALGWMLAFHLHHMCIQLSLFSQISIVINIGLTTDSCREITSPLSCSDISFLLFSSLMAQCKMIYYDI